MSASATRAARALAVVELQANKACKEVATTLAKKIGSRDGLSKVQGIFVEFDTDRSGTIDELELMMGLKNFGE
jgi:hypothetical protein